MQKINFWVIDREIVWVNESERDCDKAEYLKVIFSES